MNQSQRTINLLTGILVFMVANQATAWPSRRAGCLTLLAGSAVVGASYFFWNPAQPSMDLNLPQVVGVNREQGNERARSLSDRFVDGRLSLTLEKENWEDPRVIVFDHGVLRRTIAKRVRDELKTRIPALAAEPWMAQPGVTIVLNRLVLREDAQDPNRVFVSIVGQITELTSQESYSKSELLSERPQTIEFVPVRIPTERNGIFSVDVRAGIRYLRAENCFEVVSGRVRVALNIPHLVSEEQVVEAPRIRTEAVFSNGE